MGLKSDYAVAVETEGMIIILDLDIGGMSVTNDIHNVIDDLSLQLNGIGDRKVYYRDSMGRYDEIFVDNEKFYSFIACNSSLQDSLRRLVNG